MKVLYLAVARRVLKDKVWLCRTVLRRKFKRQRLMDKHKSKKSKVMSHEPFTIASKQRAAQNISKCFQ